MNSVNIFITVDTEHSIGGAFKNPRLRPVGNDRRILGSIDGKDFGIPLIMDIADIFNFKITFFLEVLNKYYFGSNESRTICDYILNRGHDVQLHLHPNYLNFTIDNPIRKDYSDVIGHYDPVKQQRLLEEGRDALISYGAPEVCAFRAGCFGANEYTLDAARRAGLLFDSSYNAAYRPYPCLIPDNDINDFSFIRGIGEFPVTNFIENVPFRKKYKPLDINGVSSEEIIFVLNSALEKKQSCVVIILHSFSFLKPKDIQYKKVKPRISAIRRFERVCQYLYDNSDKFHVRTFPSLQRVELNQFNDSSKHIFAVMPAVISLARYYEQIKDLLI